MTTLLLAAALRCFLTVQEVGTGHQKNFLRPALGDFAKAHRWETLYRTPKGKKKWLLLSVDLKEGEKREDLEAVAAHLVGCADEAAIEDAVVKEAKRLKAPKDWKPLKGQVAP